MSDVQRFLLLRAGVQYYALPFEQVAEVTELRPLAPVPRAPTWCPGASRSAGTIVAVVDLAAYHGEEPEPHPEKLVVLDLRLGGLALLVGPVQGLTLEAPSRLEQDAYGTWLVTPAVRAELLDARELLEEISAAMSH